MVKFAAGKYVLTVMDITARTRQTTKQACATNLVCERTSVDWILERPGYGGTNVAPLANWGTASLEGGKASAGGSQRPISSFPHFGINMMNNRLEYPLASVGPLKSSGRAFSDTWEAAG